MIIFVVVTIIINLIIALAMINLHQMKNDVCLSKETVICVSLFLHNSSTMSYKILKGSITTICRHIVLNAQQTLTFLAEFSLVLYIVTIVKATAQKNTHEWYTFPTGISFSKTIKELVSFTTIRVTGSLTNPMIYTMALCSILWAANHWFKCKCTQYWCKEP